MVVFKGLFIRKIKVLPHLGNESLGHVDLEHLTALHGDPTHFYNDCVHAMTVPRGDTVFNDASR